MLDAEALAGREVTQVIGRIVLEIGRQEGSRVVGAVGVARVRLGPAVGRPAVKLPARRDVVDLADHNQ